MQRDTIELQLRCSSCMFLNGMKFLRLNRFALSMPMEQEEINHDYL